MSTAARPIEAAGVVLHDGAGRVAVVHRPRHADWSLPKGKLEAGEPHLLAAVRECHEETGVRAVLESPLPDQQYHVNGAAKRVCYWRARVLGDDGFTPNEEIDELRWVPAGAAGTLLSYPHDAALVVRSVAVGDTRPLIVLRHAEALKRAAWGASRALHAAYDSARPLAPAGLEQADRVAAVLAAYGVTRVVTSPSRRCRQTVEPFAGLAGVRLERDYLMSEEGHVADPTGTAAVAHNLAVAPAPTALCTHRPVLHVVMRALSEALLEAGDWTIWLDPRLPPAGALVVHRGAGGQIVAIERHDS